MRQGGRKRRSGRLLDADARGTGRRPAWTSTNEEIGRRVDIPVEKVQKLKTISRDPVSLETPVGRDGESAQGDLIEDRWVGSPVDAVIEGNVRDETAAS